MGLILKTVMFLLNGMVIIALFSCSNHQKERPLIPIEELKQGDVAFRRGEGVISDIVLYSDADGLYSHVGLIVLHNDTIKVVHSVPGEHDDESDFDRVKIEPIEDFYSEERAERGEVLRMNLTEEQRECVAKLALEKVVHKVKFDHDYNLNDTTKLYCTEFVQLMFKNVGIDLAEGRISDILFPGMSNKYIMPSDLYKNKKLTSIYKY